MTHSKFRHEYLNMKMVLATPKNICLVIVVPDKPLKILLHRNSSDCARTLCIVYTWPYLVMGWYVFCIALFTNYCIHNTKLPNIVKYRLSHIIPERSTVFLTNVLSFSNIPISLTLSTSLRLFYFSSTFHPLLCSLARLLALPRSFDAIE